MLPTLFKTTYTTLCYAIVWSGPENTTGYNQIWLIDMVQRPGTRLGRDLYFVAYEKRFQRLTSFILNAGIFILVFPGLGDFWKQN